MKDKAEVFQLGLIGMFSLKGCCMITISVFLAADAMLTTESFLKSSSFIAVTCLIYM